MRLSVGDLVGGDHHFRKRYSAQLQPSAGELAPSGGDHAPAAGRNRTDEFDRSGHHANAVSIRRLLLFQFRDFGFRVEVRSDNANHFDGADAVGDGDDFLLIDSPLPSPYAPLAVDGSGGIDQNSVEVK